MVTYKLGNKGDTVKQIQQALIDAGFGVVDGKKLIADGVFGAITEKAVRAFQAKKGLTQDGIVGSKTLSLLIPTRYKKSKRTINEIVIHCTATPEGQDKTVEQLRYEHTLPVSKGGRGWSDIGYHYVIYRNGHIATGRDVDKIGAHCTGHNAHSIGIAYVGGVENKKGVPYENLPPKDTRTLAQKDGLLSLLMDLRKLYPKAKILGHRDTSPDKNGNGTVEPFEWIKECPCFDAKKEYKDV